MTQVQRVPCHYRELFIDCDGDVFPCCLVGGREDLRIGHLSDDDLLGRFDGFDGTCRCDRYQLRRASSADRIAIDTIQLQFSLVCNARCAMCIAGSPNIPSAINHPPFAHFQDLGRFISALVPKRLVVSGGEILIQRDTLKWLETIRGSFPDMAMTLVTNGYARPEIVDSIENIFTSYIVSIYAFQPETYRRISEVNMEAVTAFVDAIVRRHPEKIGLKFLTTPVSFHEAPLFPRWALERSPARVVIRDAESNLYINFRWHASESEEITDLYWRRILSRTTDLLKSELINAKSLINGRGIIIDFAGPIFPALGLDRAFAEEQCLETLVFTDSGPVSRLRSVSQDLDELTTEHAAAQRQLHELTAERDALQRRLEELRVEHASLLRYVFRRSARSLLDGCNKLRCLIAPSKDVPF